MLRQEVEIINKLGMHARAAAKLVTLAQTFQAEIKIVKDGKQVNGKSIMGIMMLAAAKGSTIELIADGEDEADAMTHLVKLINSRFDENE